ncbi:MAG: hypothetical protein H0U66_12245 [Gemmatimonadaceae bacterium]|nr:hypothetical protein [Gemmatimonadaceae bacterium]
MPAYAVEFTTERGLQRTQFTLDDDRPLGPQVRQILEELRGTGVVISGTAEDELSVVWGGRDLDTTQAPQQLGINPQRTIELHMKRRARAVKIPAVAPFVPKGAYAAAVSGMAGALLAWLVCSTITDLSDALPTYARLDLAVGGMIGVFAGGFIAGSDALRRRTSLPLGVLFGVLLGLVGGVAGGAAGAGLGGVLAPRLTPPGFVVARILAWVVLGSALGLTLGMRWWQDDERRTVDGAGYGALAGLVAGILYSLPGPSEFWQALAFVILGAGVGAGVCAPALRRSVAILELERGSRGRIGLTRLREWGLLNGESVALERDGATVASVVCESTRCRIVPSGAGVRVSGKTVSAPTELVNEDRIAIGDAQYRFRRRRRVSA